MPSLMAIRTIHTPSEAIGKVAKWEWVTYVELDLKARLAPVGRERPLANDETHNVADIELAHATIIATCSRVEQSHVARGGAGAARPLRRAAELDDAHRGAPLVIARRSCSWAGSRA